jgi:hypothetical protein
MIEFIAYAQTLTTPSDGSYITVSIFFATKKNKKQNKKKDTGHSLY